MVRTVESDLFHERERVESEKERVSRRVSSEKKIKFLADTCSNLQFLWVFPSSHLSRSRHVGPA